MQEETESYFTLEDQLEAMSVDHSFIDTNDRMFIISIKAISLTRFFWSVQVSKNDQIELFTGFCREQLDAKKAVRARMDEACAGDPKFIDWTFVFTRPGESRSIR